ncbi:hypothetical protein CPB86DRAFT_780073 [Serendipita vermifera]|nr:hypothetical protein CPB86DRAFT_780073 [Serendipita vermifera]
MVPAWLTHWIILQLCFWTGFTLGGEKGDPPAPIETSREGDENLDYPFEVYLDRTVSLCSPFSLRWEGGNPPFELWMSTEKWTDTSIPPPNLGKSVGETSDWSVSLYPSLYINVGDVVWYTVVDRGGYGKTASAATTVDGDACTPPEEETSTKGEDISTSESSSSSSQSSNVISTKPTPPDPTTYPAMDPRPSPILAHPSTASSIAGVGVSTGTSHWPTDTSTLPPGILAPGGDHDHRSTPSGIPSDEDGTTTSINTDPHYQTTQTASEMNDISGNDSLTRNSEPPGVRPAPPSREPNPPLETAMPPNAYAKGNPVATNSHIVVVSPAAIGVIIASKIISISLWSLFLFWRRRRRVKMTRLDSLPPSP